MYIYIYIYTHHVHIHIPIHIHIHIHNFEIIRDNIREGKAEHMEGFMRVLAMAAEEKLRLKPPIMKKKDCHPELDRLVACRKSHWNRTMKKK